MDDRLMHAIKLANLNKTIKAYVSESFAAMKQELFVEIDGHVVEASSENINLIDLLIRRSRQVYLYDVDGDIVLLDDPLSTLDKLMDIWGRASNRHHTRLKEFKDARSVVDVVNFKVKE